MALNYYQFIRCHGNNKVARKYEVFRFQNDFNDKYLVEVFHYDYNVYAIKFFMKKHRLSENRYNITYPQKFKERRGCKTGNSNFLKVMNTVLKISLEISKKDNLASFGFMGAPKLKENDPKINSKNINPDNTVANTKRYKVYHLYARRYFNPHDFEYIDSCTSSILLLRNNRNKNVLTKQVAEEYINNEIIPNL